MFSITGTVKESNVLGKSGPFQTQIQDLHLKWGLRRGNAKKRLHETLETAASSATFIHTFDELLIRVASLFLLSFNFSLDP